MSTTISTKEIFAEVFRLAQLGETAAFPNPIVGAVVLDAAGNIVGKGFHRRFGSPHAEVNAINSVLENNPNYDFSNSTIYVSLEPCSHYGKTPPCADLIIQKNFKKLVFSSYDPNPLVSGKGIERIRSAGIEIIEPNDLDEEICKESDFLNRVFFSFIKNPDKKIWLTIKVAKTIDGRMITEEDEARWITNQNSRKEVHRMRSCHQALVTSVKTIMDDNPSLNVRHSKEELALSDLQNPDIIIPFRNTAIKAEHKEQLHLFKQFANAEKSNRKLFELQLDGLDDLKDFCIDQGYKKIILEAGPSLSQAFIDHALFDEIVHFQPYVDKTEKEILGDYDFSENNFSVSSKTITKATEVEANDLLFYLTKKI